MPQASDKAGRVVFIGNIPYGVPEEEIQGLLSRVGNVIDFRIVTDRETGKPKGFGFAEFTEHDAAAAAVRNLNDYDVQGRKLRVDWSNENGSGGDGGQPRAPPAAAPVNGQSAVAAQSSAILPPLPPGAELPPDISCPDQISRTLNTLPAAQLLDVLSQMKNLVKQDPARATELLTQSPQLSYAIFQSLLMLGLVESNVLGQIIQAQPPAPQPAPVAAPPPQMPNYAQYNQPAHIPTPPVAQPQYHHPPPQAPPQAPPPVDPKVIQQVLALTRDQILGLPPDAQQQIIAMRMQFGVPPPGY